MFDRVKSIKLSNYFDLVKPEYIYLKIIPHKSIRNYNSANIIKAIAHTYRAINKRVYKQQKKLFFETNFKISYVIDIEGNNASFYFIVPKVFQNIIIEKVREIWSKATIELAEGIKDFNENTDYYELMYKKEDALSLQVDRKSNEPLNSILSVMDIMKDEDRVTLVYNFIPRSQFGWLEQYQATIDKVRKNKAITKDTMSFEYILKTSLGVVLELLDMVMTVFNDFTGGKPIEQEESLYSSVMKVLERQNELTATTKKKKEATIVNCQIGVASTSLDATRRGNNALTVCQSFRSLDEDNELVYKQCKKFNLEQHNLNITNNVISAEEGSNFIQIPARTLLSYFNIRHIKTEETSIPEELRTGYISLGMSKFKGTKVEGFIQDHKEIGNLPLFIDGRQGGGKTTYLCNYANYCQRNNESIVHVDFIKNNEASKSIESVCDKDKVIVLDFSTEEGLQALAYNEIKFTDKTSWFDRQALANKKTELTIELLNSINEDCEPLSPKMQRYLCACTDIVYLNENATLKDIIRCLQDYKYRELMIDKIPSILKDELVDEIQALNELDEWSKATKDNPSEKIGTRDSKIEGILDRMTLLKRDFYLKKMFNKTPENNLDFVKAMEEGKAILIRMPQSKFKNYVKNVITTFIVTKCWLAAELRGEMTERSKRVHVLIDEISQTKTAERYMETILTQTRKFGIKFVLVGQYLDQLDKKTIYTLKGAGCSFMLLKGTIKEDFEYLKDEIEGFEYEDLKDMEQHSSLNLVSYSKGYSSFITKLPKPLKEKAL